MNPAKFLACVATGLLFFLSACGGGGGGGAATSEAVAVQAELVLRDIFFPVGLSSTPDGRIFFTELKTGRIRTVFNGQPAAVPFATLEVPSAGADGVLGVAVDPNFESNRYVYVFHTLEDPYRNRVIRFRDQSGLGTEPFILVDNLPSGGHNGGKFAFDRDGNIFISTGDAGDPALSQDLNSLAGKILRITKDGGIPSNNPFPGSPIYAYGFRNVFGLSIDPRSGKLFASENGPECDDELNLIEAGGNYGWRPEQECGEALSDFVQPLERFTPSLGLTGIAFYQGELFPEFRNQLFVTDYNTGNIRRFSVDSGSGQIQSAEILYPGGVGPILEIAAATDGHLYFTTQDALYRIQREVVPPEEPLPLAPAPTPESASRHSQR